jgi:hypothetical protein
VQKINFAFLLRRYSSHNNCVKEKREDVKGNRWLGAPKLATAMLKHHTSSTVGATRKLSCRIINNR